MSDITRSEAIKTLKEHLSHWERLLQEHICEDQEGIDTISALKLAIASLETEAPQERKRALDNTS